MNESRGVLTRLEKNFAHTMDVIPRFKHDVAQMRSNPYKNASKYLKETQVTYVYLA